MDDLSLKVIQTILFGVVAGFVTLLFFFVRGYFKRIQEDRKALVEENKDLSDKYSTVDKSLLSITNSLKNVVDNQNKIDSRLDNVLEGQANLSKEVAKVDGQVEIMRRNSKEDSEKIQDAVRDIKAIWRFTDGAHKRASDSVG